MNEYIYIKVTPDKYSLIEIVTDSLEEMAEATGLKAETIKWYCSKTAHNRQPYHHFERIKTDE